MDIGVYYGDLMDHVNKICDTLDEAREIIEVYKDTDFILGTDRVNRVMRVLTILSTIILPFVVISSIYGMNVILPGGFETNGNLIPFGVLMVGMAGRPLNAAFLPSQHWIRMKTSSFCRPDRPFCYLSHHGKRHRGELVAFVPLWF
jgi:hypothetical protein